MQRPNNTAPDYSKHNQGLLIMVGWIKQDSQGQLLSIIKVEYTEANEMKVVKMKNVRLGRARLRYVGIIQAR